MSRRRLTIRTRLALVYGGLFLLAGVVLLAVTYALVSARLRGELGTRSDERGGRGLTNESRIAADASHHALAALLTQGGIALAVVSVAALSLGWLIAGHLLQPLHRMTRTARRIADASAEGRGLRERIALDGPDDDIKELADTFDVMLERLDRSLDGQRRFIANASHELRTPLTLNRTLLEVAADPATASPEMRQLAATLLAVNTRHERLIDGLLLLARSEREVLEHSVADLADLVEHVVDRTPPGQCIVHTVLAEAETTGDPVLLERLVQNLVENGIRHNVPDGGWVRVVTGAGADGTARLEVTNSGPVVSPHDIPGLFEPFRRLRADRLAVPGAGLGLSIVRAVARAHGGTVHAVPRAGGGLVVTVALTGLARPVGPGRVRGEHPARQR